VSVRDHFATDVDLALHLRRLPWRRGDHRALAEQTPRVPSLWCVQAIHAAVMEGLRAA
jgi:hypothetical protein